MSAVLEKDEAKLKLAADEERKAKVIASQKKEEPEKVVVEEKKTAPKAPAEVAKPAAAAKTSENKPKEAKKAATTPVKADSAVAKTESGVIPAHQYDASYLKDEIVYLKQGQRDQKDENIKHLDRLIKQLKY